MRNKAWDEIIYPRLLPWATKIADIALSSKIAPFYQTALSTIYAVFRLVQNGTYTSFELNGYYHGWFKN